MTRPTRRYRTAMVGIAATIAAVGVSAGTSLSADAAPKPSGTGSTMRSASPASASLPHGSSRTMAPSLAPTSAARAAGIARVGDAYMGWKDRHLAMTTKVVNGKVVLTPTALPGGAAPAGTATPSAVSSSSVSGIDVSHWQGTVNWASWYSKGKRFAYVKATEGTSYTSSTFSAQYSGAYKAGLMRGAYHFALPNSSSGATQADYFVAHGGGWSADGKTLPGVLDFEYNPYGSTCYGKSASSLASWVSSFVKEYKAKTGRDAVIYTAYNFWVPCVGNSKAFGATNPLWVARYSSTAGTLFGGWGWYTFWQYTDSPLDLDVFNGSTTRLKALALG